jgi:hypothetical protein
MGNLIFSLINSSSPLLVFSILHIQYFLLVSNYKVLKKSKNNIRYFEKCNAQLLEHYAEKPIERLPTTTHKNCACFYV